MSVTDSIFGIFGNAIELVDKASSSVTARMFLDEEKYNLDTQTPYGVGGRGTAVESGRTVSGADSKRDGIPLDMGGIMENYGMWFLIVPAIFLAIKILK